MRDEMVKRVSEAILNTPNSSDYATLVAKRAIAAMRDPTEAMIKAGTIYWDPCDGGPITALFDPVKPYQLMIDKAIGD